MRAAFESNVLHMIVDVPQGQAIGDGTDGNQLACRGSFLGYGNEICMISLRINCTSEEEQ